MIVIHKKRLQIIITCIIIGVFAFTFQIANNKTIDEKNTNTQMQNSIATTATPVSGKTIVVDAGHGVPDEGAESSTRNYRSRNKFKNSIKIAKLIRNKWKYSYINTFR